MCVRAYVPVSSVRRTLGRIIQTTDFLSTFVQVVCIQYVHSIVHMVVVSLTSTLHIP